MEVTIPSGMTVMWIRHLGDRNFGVKTKGVTSNGTEIDFGFYLCGPRYTARYTPDGSVGDSYWNVHDWIPIPFGNRNIVKAYVCNAKGGDPWISGVAFSTNPWNFKLSVIMTPLGFK